MKERTQAKLERAYFVVTQILFIQLPYYIFLPHKLFVKIVDLTYKSRSEEPYLISRPIFYTILAALLPVLSILLGLGLGRLTVWHFLVAASFLFPLSAISVGSWMCSIRYYAERRYDLKGDIRFPDPTIWKTLAEAENDCTFSNKL